MTLSALVLASFLAAQLVSLDAKEMDLGQFLRLIGTTANLNVVIHPEVQGKVNVMVKDLPWEQVLDSVLTTHGLEKEINGNTMLIAPVASLPLRTYIYFPKYSRATELAPVVATLLSPRGSVVAYPARNALIVRDVRPLSIEIPWEPVPAKTP
jgi:type II secretory pathway component HofQ